MSRIARVVIVLLAALLGGSLGLNYFLFKKGTVFFKDLHRTKLDPFDLDAYPVGSIPIDRAKGPVIVFFGDSRAAAWPPPPMSGVQFINRGIKGETTAQAVGRFPQHVASFKPQRVVIQIGINDLKTIPTFPDRRNDIVQKVKGNLQLLVDLSLASGAQVTLTTIFPLGKLELYRRPFWSDEVARAVDEVNVFIRSLANEKVAVFDAYKVLVNANGIVTPAYSLDFLHLNATGYEALNREVPISLR